MLRLYNSLGRRLENFVPILDGEVRMYTCGPTVWNYAHVGNFRTFTFEDVLRRYLVFKGFRVIQVKNLTDVEDRIIRGIKETGMSLKDLTNFYSAAFMRDIEALNFQKADYYPRATEHIAEMLSMINSLLKSGHAYRAEDGSIYYSIRTFANYGALSGVKPAELKEGARVSADHYEKMGAHDFALWKAWDPDDGEVFWETEFGKGRPGWHIECSAMAIKYLGESFDIHTGGKDLRFPHHENEIAQSEAVTGKKFARYWLHAEFLNVQGEKMAKSQGNFVTLRELLDEGLNPRAIRLFLLSAHYRDELNLTDESLEQASRNISRLDELVSRLQSANPGSGVSPDPGVELSRSFLREFEAAMDEDLNVPMALASLFNFQRTTNSIIDSGKLTHEGRAATMDALRKVDSVIGVMKFEGDQLSPELAALVEQRDSARKAGDFKRADELREELKRRGIVLQDTPTGTKWRRA